MSNDITLSEVQEFIAGFWYHYDQGHFDELALRIGDEMEYLSRSESGDCPFEELLAAELHGGAETLAWLTQHRNENPYPLRHHATNIFRTGIDGPVTNVRFYLFVNQVTNAVPFAVSSGVVDVGDAPGRRRPGVHLDECHSGRRRFGALRRVQQRSSSAAAGSRRVTARDTFGGGVAVITGAGCRHRRGPGPSRRPRSA